MLLNQQRVYIFTSSGQPHLVKLSTRKSLLKYCQHHCQDTRGCDLNLDMNAIVQEYRNSDDYVEILSKPWVCVEEFVTDIVTIYWVGDPLATLQPLREQGVNVWGCDSAISNHTTLSLLLFPNNPHAFSQVYPSSECASAANILLFRGEFRLRLGQLGQQLV